MTSSTDPINDQVAKCVEHYEKHKSLFTRLATTLHANLTGDERLDDLLHSSMSRCKDPEHLRKKILRKIREGDERYTSITPDTLFEVVTDLTGVRLLHLHSNQVHRIHPIILEILAQYKYTLVEQPFANAWDQEFKAIYDALGIKVDFRESMYTSVHYVVSTDSQIPIRAEIQVRTLMEEVWGEISHTINYPEPTTNHSCTRQLKVLARVVSTGSRLVDAIMDTHDEAEVQTPIPAPTLNLQTSDHANPTKDAADSG
jgi:putative GTP pyrophosphokinase